MTTKTQNKEIEAFKFFCGTDCYKAMYHTPFMQGDYYYATDGVSIVRAKKDDFDFNFEYKEDPHVTERIFSLTEREPIKIKTIKLKTELERLKEDIDELEECVYCDGEGYEECDLGHEHECEYCFGVGGNKTGNKVPNPDKVYSFINKLYSHKQLERLVKFCEYIGADNFYNVGYNDNSLLFRVNDFDIVVMMIRDVDQERTKIKL